MYLHSITRLRRADCDETVEWNNINVEKELNSYKADKEEHNVTNSLTIYSALYVRPVCPSVHFCAAGTAKGLPWFLMTNNTVLTMKFSA